MVQAAVGITLEDNAYLYLKGGGPVAIVYPEVGTSAIADGMALCEADVDGRGRIDRPRPGPSRRVSAGSAAGPGRLVER